jgi:chemotaxis protein CheD
MRQSVESGVAEKIQISRSVAYGAEMEEIIDVNTGQVKLGRGEVILRSLAIGSCIAVAAYDSRARIGAMAHIMLPGSAPEESSEANRYAANAIEEMIGMMVKAHSQKSDIEVCLVGAGNVLQKDDDIICQANTESITQLFAAENIPIRATALGGFERKSVFLCVESGNISYRKGGRQEEPLWGAATC